MSIMSFSFHLLWLLLLKKITTQPGTRGERCTQHILDDVFHLFSGFWMPNVWWINFLSTFRTTRTVCHRRDCMRAILQLWLCWGKLNRGWHPTIRCWPPQSLQANTHAGYQRLFGCQMLVRSRTLCLAVPPHHKSRSALCPAWRASFIHADDCYKPHTYSNSSCYNWCGYDCSCETDLDRYSLNTKKSQSWDEGHLTDSQSARANRIRRREESSGEDRDRDREERMSGDWDNASSTPSSRWPPVGRQVTAI